MIDHATYRSARREGGAFRLGTGDLIRLRGKDALDLLHRITTADLRALKRGDARETLFTTEKGRIVDAVTLLIRSGELLLVPSPGRRDAVRRWIEKFIIMDDAVAEDVAMSFEHWHIRSGAAAGRLLAAVPPSDSIAMGAWRSFPAGDSSGFMYNLKSVTTPGLHILMPTGPEEEALRGILDRASVPNLSAELYDLLRIEEGLPRIDHELTDAVNPLEAGARESVSFTKGCYIGQEVIARLDTYDKVQRRLCGLRIDPAPAEPVPPGTECLAEGENAGFVTSSALHPPTGQGIGLGLIRNAFAGGDRALTFAVGGVTYRAHPTALPMMLGEENAA